MVDSSARRDAAPESSTTSISRGRGIFRSIFYLPSIIPAVASCMVWVWLLNQQYGNALLIDIFDDRHNIVYDQGRKAKRRFIEQQDLWFAHQSSGDCQHLLFPAGHGSGPLFLSLIQPREHFIGALEARCAILDRIAAEEQIFLNS